MKHRPTLHGYKDDVDLLSTLFKDFWYVNCPDWWSGTRIIDLNKSAILFQSAQFVCLHFYSKLKNHENTDNSAIHLKQR